MQNAPATTPRTPRNPNTRYFIMAQNIDANAFIETFKKHFLFQYCLDTNKPAEGTKYFDALVETGKKTFEGRMGKQEYLLYIVPAIILAHIPIVNLILILPNCSCTARRLHDLGLTGWISLLMIVPIISILLVIYLCITDGQKEKNEFGEVPAE